MKYTVRPIEPKDNLSVEKVIRSCLIEFGANHAGTAWEDPFLHRFSEVYNSPGNKYWVVEDEQGNIVGGAGIGYHTDEICELQKMYCLPVVRGTGVSHELMRLCLDYAKDYYKICFLETFHNMHAAIKFYEKFDFQRIEKSPVDTGHYGCDVPYILYLR